MQILWYAKNIFQDEEDEFEVSLDLLEYLASFINSEGVKKARQARNADVVSSDLDLEEVVKQGGNIFGNLDDIKEITKSLGKDTNKKMKSSNPLDIQSPIHNIIRD